MIFICNMLFHLRPRLHWGFQWYCFVQGRNVVVFYGSQTGTAEEFAGRLAKDASRYGMKAIVADPEESEMVTRNSICLWLTFLLHSNILEY